MLRLTSFLRNYPLFKPKKLPTLSKSPLILPFQSFYHSPNYPNLHSINSFSFSFTANPPFLHTNLPSDELESALPEEEESSEAPEREFKNLFDKYGSKMQHGIFTRREVLIMVNKLSEMTDPKRYSGFTLKYYTKAAQIAEMAGVDDCTEVGGLYVWIVTLYLNGEKVDNIDSYLEKGIQVYKNAIESNDIEAKSGLIHMEFAKGLVYKKQEKLDEAFNIFQMILDQESEITDGDVCLLPQIYENLGDICEKRRELAQASAYFEQALEAISDSEDGTEDMIIYLKRLIVVNVNREKYPKALEYAHKSLELSLKHYGENDPRVGSSYNTLAEIHLRRREFDKSIKYHEKGMKILAKFPEFSKDRALRDKVLLASAYFRNKNDDQAQEFFKETLKDIVMEEGENCTKLAGFYHFWGEILAGQADTESRSIEFFKKALEIYSKCENQDDSTLILANFIRGQIYFFENKYERAIAYFKEALQLSIGLGKRPKPIEEIYRFLGAAYLRAEKFPEAIEYAQKAIQVCKASQGRNLSSHYESLGLAYEKSGWLEKAAETYQKALDVYPEGLRKQEKKMKRVKLLSDMLRKLGMKKKAQEVLEYYGNDN